VAEITAPARQEIAFADLSGWDCEEAEALLEGLSRHFPEAIRKRPHQAPWLPRAAEVAAARSGPPRAFVEGEFRALSVAQTGFLTGYYEPVIAASRTRTERHAAPLYRRPPDLVRVDPPRVDLPGDGTWARRRPDGTLTAYHDRAAIVGGAIDGMGLELAFVADPVDAFFAQVQGSARLLLPGGETVRVGYHGRNGHPYTAIGRVMIDEGILPEGGATMQSIRAALAAAPARVADILNRNRSFVFFRERPSMGAAAGPIAAGGVPLVPWRSLAVDRSYIALGTPVHVETEIPGKGRWSGVTIAEDTGTAIVGPARGDLFFGSGEAAGALAGAMKSPAGFTLIVPRGVAA